MIALIAFALLASTVSAQTANFWFYSGSGNCTSAGATAVVNTTVPINTCSLVNNTGTSINVKAVCNNVTGIVIVTAFGAADTLCNSTTQGTFSSAVACNPLGASSFSIQNCTVVSPATASPTNPSNGTLAPTATPTPGNGTNAPTVKPGSASQQAGLSMIAAVAVMVIAML